MNYTVSNKKGNIILDDDMILKIISSLCNRVTNIKLDSISYKKDNNDMYYFYLNFAKTPRNTIIVTFDKIANSLKRLIKLNTKIDDFVLVLNANS
ncbi:MAG: hypothetical protein LBM72_02930 [Mycoplasmataceae bacterium]|jgi:hypothetical protein|nr:hypothetical protein [Mycoplasmataceae bacterium]